MSRSTEHTQVRKIAVIVPVYGDWDSLSECIQSLKAYISPDVEVIFANDRGPDHNKLEKNILESIEGYDNFSYYANEVNLGFIKNCNNAIRRLSSQERDILLLNSDTIVTKGFLREISDVAYLDERIATVCPRSNDATIASIPLRRADERVPYTRELSYDIYQSVSKNLPRYVQAPVSVGFCFYIKRSVIDKIGLLDEIYGKGYGEEDDFCMRANQAGFISVIANHAFVYHQSARSFTPTVRNQLIEQNAKILLSRYPYFSELVQKYLDYEEGFYEHFAEVIYRQGLKKRCTVKVMIDLYEHPPAELARTRDIVRLLENLDSSLKVTFTVATSYETRDFLAVANPGLDWVAPHEIKEQYDIAFSPFLLRDVAHAKMLRDSAARHVFGPQIKDDYCDNTQRTASVQHAIRKTFLAHSKSIPLAVYQNPKLLARSLKDIADKPYGEQDEIKWEILTSLSMVLSDKQDPGLKTGRNTKARLRRISQFFR